MKTKAFFDTEFKGFSIYDNERSIPNMIDGFKPSQRKSIYGMVKRGENAGEIKVAQAAPYCSQVTDYHHGEVSLEGTIVGLAQKYPGSNNMNFLVPEGQFGTRLSKNPSAARYIFTKVSDDFRKIFKKDDDHILEYLHSDGMQIEPKIYYPILPTVLINGSRGTGTGFASNILNYNPKEIRELILNEFLKRKIKVRKSLVPWYRGFTGGISRNEDGQVTIEGSYEIVNTTTIKITELPIGTYLDKYKVLLNKLQEKGIVKGWDDDSNEESWDFTLTVPRTTTKMNHDKIMETFKLISRDTENYTLWNENGNIQVYKDVRDIIKHFVEFRLTKYEERRKKLIEIYTADRNWLKEKYRFIVYYLKNHMKFAKKGKKALFEMLKNEEFVEIDRLLRLPIYFLTGDNIKSLNVEIKTASDKIKYYTNITNKELYIKELEELI